MRARAVWLFLVIAAAVAGYLVGAGSGEDRSAPARSAAPRPRAESAPAAPPADRLPAAEATGNAGRDLVDAPDDARNEEIAARAARKRRAYLVAAENAESEAAREVAEEIRHELAFVEDKARGGTMELLRNLGKEGTYLTGLVADESRFSGLFERRTAGPVVNGPLRPAETLPDGATLSFPPGVDNLRFPSTDRFAKDLLVLGYGMDATLVRLDDELDTRGEVHSLTFRDLTIDCHENYFTDLRRAPAAIRLERCRVVGFDMGAGGSVMIQAPQAAFHATDCRFEAGFSRAQAGYGNLFRVDAGVVRFDGCLIQGPFSSIYDAGRGTTYRFRRCAIRDAPGREESNFASPPDGVRFVECTFTYLPAQAQTPDKPRPLSDLNPAWPGR